MEPITTDSKTAENITASNMDHKCTVCHKAYCEPKLLPCGHLMCRKCLLSWLKQTRRATCPYCRYPILKDDEDRQDTPSASQCKDEAPTEGCTDVDDKELQVLVDRFPTELWTAALVKAEKLLREEQKCQVCEEQATSICLQCGDTLCGSCKQIHTKFTMSSHHVVEDLSGLTAERLADCQPHTLCPNHPNEPCRMFCTQHTTSLCMQCALSGHRTCPQVSDLEQIERAREKLKELLKMITDGSTSIESALSELDQHLADMEQRTETALVAIRTLKERLIKAVDDCTQRLEQKTNEAQEDIRQAVKEAKAFLLGRQSRLGTHATLTQRVQQSKARDVVCGMTSAMEARVNEIEPHEELPKGAKAITTAKLIVDEDEVVCIEQVLAELGYVNVEPSAVAANVCERFHFIHGQNITLSNGRRTARRTQGNNYSAVVVSRPMAIGDRIEVQIDQWDLSAFGNTGYPILGVATQSPDTLNLQQQAWSFQMGSTVVITSNGAYVSGANQNPPHQVRDRRSGNYTTQQQPCPVGQHLKSVRQGSRVGVYLDASHNLRLYVDGQDKGVFARNVKQPCYALFDVCDYAKQVTLQHHKKV